ncbi:unnamed protein product [Sphagnum compactum]
MRPRSRDMRPQLRDMITWFREHEVMHVCGSFMGVHEERGARIGTEDHAATHVWSKQALLRIAGNYYCRNSSSSSSTSCSSMLFWVSLGGKQDHHVLQGRTFELRFFSLHREIHPSSRRNRRPRETAAS